MPTRYLHNIDDAAERLLTASERRVPTAPVRELIGATDIDVPSGRTAAADPSARRTEQRRRDRPGRRVARRRVVLPGADVARESCELAPRTVGGPTDHAHRLVHDVLLGSGDDIQGCTRGGDCDPGLVGILACPVLNGLQGLKDPFG